MEERQIPIPVIFFGEAIGWRDPPGAADHDERWRETLNSLRLVEDPEIGDGRLACSVTYPDAGPPTCDDHGMTARSVEPKASDAPVPAIFFLQPESIRPLESPERLRHWEKFIADRYGFRRAADGGSSATDTETVSLGTNDDCDVKGDAGVAFG
jgi:hypothetical protein